MNLPLHQLIPAQPIKLFNQTIDPSWSLIASAGSDSSIYSAYPLIRLRSPLAYSATGLRAICPYDRTSNLLFLLPAGGARAENKVLLWDDATEKVVLQLEYAQEEKVMGARCRRDKLVVVLRRKIILYHLDFEKDRSQAVVREAEYETCENPLGLAAIATTAGSSLLAFPGRQAGQVQLIRLPPLAFSATPNSKPSSIPYPTIHIFLSHSSPLRTLTLSPTGSLLATSSNKGTLIRIFNTTTKSLVRELRRGTDQADIWSVCFADPDRGGKVACSSDKGTIHIWQVGDLSSTSTSSLSAVDKGKGRDQQPTTSSSEKNFNILKPYLPAYFSSQWSILTWKIPDPMALHGMKETKEDDVASCIFLPASTDLAEQDQLLVVTRSGAWFRLSTDTERSVQKVGSEAKVKNKEVETRRETMKHCTMLEYRRLGQGGDAHDWD